MSVIRATRALGMECGPPSMRGRKFSVRESRRTDTCFIKPTVETENDRIAI